MYSKLYENYIYCSVLRALQRTEMAFSFQKPTECSFLSTSHQKKRKRKKAFSLLINSQEFCQSMGYHTFLFPSVCEDLSRQGPLLIPHGAFPSCYRGLSSWVLDFSMSWVGEHRSDSVCIFQPGHCNTLSPLLFFIHFCLGFSVSLVQLILQWTVQSCPFVCHLLAFETHACISINHFILCLSLRYMAVY